jgi:formate dehydrogenase
VNCASVPSRPEYARDDIPVVEGCPDGQPLPRPKGLDFRPGELVGSVSGELGLRSFLEENGHTLVITSDKEGPPTRSSTANCPTPTW